ncbi:peptidylprolyl isomerase [Allorhizobium borbori]|uniref:Peptidyl-prolyl cis-trans isomerase n=1 Tax=Allorhizobium borbori TaxID=485907 RepID=A0A7W6P133_9HYPH|nr:peptidylprolyl isomerase [Allorhizobium borbori]MBB4102324.1 cyclophilin family peptidyl-prolyl cis-trans isomerase [Allorhizobium borbori]PZU20673.1 MAG: peptidylprolyl isomerase [Shinella sp.]
MKLLGFALAGALTLSAFTTAFAADDFLTIQLKDGPVVIELLPKIAPKHVERLKELAASGQYDNVAFHRVIDGFMAQTGDVEYGNMSKNFDARRAGMGGSDKPDLPAEFSKTPFERGTVGMARSQDPNSANSQFFIMFDQGSFLNGQYTVVGKVVSGMEAVDKIKRGAPGSGSVTNPDKMIKVTVGK